MIRDGSPLDDPAVGAGFAAAYDGDPWPDEPPVPSSPVPSPPVPSPPVPSPPVPSQEGPSAADPLPRPLLREGRGRRAAPARRRSPGRASAGAAVSVGGVLLGIGSLLWLTGEPPVPADQAAREAAPAVVQEVPVETEVAPADPAPPPPATQPPAPPPPATQPPAPAVQPAPPAPAAQPATPRVHVVPVTVLNNSDRTGLADRAAARFERGGWPVELTGNFRGRIPVTTVYYDPGLETSARAFAARFDGVVRVRPRFATLPARGVVVVLTREFAA